MWDALPELIDNSIQASLKNAMAGRDFRIDVYYFDGGSPHNVRRAATACTCRRVALTHASLLWLLQSGLIVRDCGHGLSSDRQSRQESALDNSEAMFKPRCVLQRV